MLLSIEEVTVIKLSCEKWNLITDLRELNKLLGISPLEYDEDKGMKGGFSIYLFFGETVFGAITEMDISLILVQETTVPPFYHVETSTYRIPIGQVMRFLKYKIPKWQCCIQFKAIQHVLVLYRDQGMKVRTRH